MREETCERSRFSPLRLRRGAWWPRDDDVLFTDSCDDGDYECVRHVRPTASKWNGAGPCHGDGCDGVRHAATKRSSLDRLNGDLIGLAGPCDGDGCDDARRAAKRSSLDRLNGDLISVVGPCDGDGCDDARPADKRGGPSWSAVSSSHTVDRPGGTAFVRRPPAADARPQLSADVYRLLRRLELLAGPSSASF